MSVRRAGPADVNAVRTLTRQAYAKWIPLIGREPRPMTANYEEALQDHWIDLCEWDGTVVGLIEMIPRQDHLIIENVAVAESFQGQGLGTMLLTHAERQARAAGFVRLRLYTNAKFAANLAFYVARGYREESRASLPDGGVVVHFAKDVS